MVARGNVPAHEAQTLGDGINHILALDVVHDTTSTVLVALAARGASQPRTCEHRRRVQTVGVGAQGHAKATTGVRGAAGTVVAEGINARRWAGWLRLDEGAAAGAQVAIFGGHSIQQPEDTKRGSQSSAR